MDFKEAHKSIHPSHCLQTNMCQYWGLPCTGKLNSTHLTVQDDGEFNGSFSSGLHVVWEYTTAITTTPTPTTATTARTNKYAIMISLYIEMPFFSDLKQPWLLDWILFHNNQKSYFFSIYKIPCFQIIKIFPQFVLVCFVLFSDVS